MFFQCPILFDFIILFMFFEFLVQFVAFMFFQFWMFLLTLILKVTAQKFNFLQSFPQYQTFFVCYKHVSLNVRVSVYLDLKFQNLSPFAWKHHKIRQKGTNCEILKLNNRRLRRLKIHVYNKKKSCNDRGNPTKNEIF